MRLPSSAAFSVCTSWFCICASWLNLPMLNINYRMGLFEPEVVHNTPA